MHIHAVLSYRYYIIPPIPHDLIFASLHLLTSSSSQYCAKFRPGCMVICLTPDATVARQSSGFLQGVHGLLVDSLEDSAGLARDVSIEAIKAGLAKDGDLMVVVAGNTYGQGATDQIRIEVLASHYWDQTTDPAGTSAREKGRAEHVGHLQSGFRIPKYE
jgi:pyruvate kinase